MMLHYFHFTMLCMLVATNAVQAEQEIASKPTVMTVKEMCGGCVKRITERFDGVEGIGNVSCDIDSKSVTVTAAEGYRLRPRGLWIIMDDIGKTPVKLVSPQGTFTSLPPKK